MAKTSNSGKTKLIIIIVVAVIGIALCGVAAVFLLKGKNASAKTVQLTKSEGTVNVSDDDGDDVKIRENMNLYSGYSVETEERSYAWLVLDDTKLAKLDMASELEIEKKDNALDILLVSGNIFFNITKPLGEDESMDIHTSTMVAGIRGTCGWVEVNETGVSNIYILEGKVKCTVTDPDTGAKKSATVKSGEKAAIYIDDSAGGDDRCVIDSEEIELEDIPGFILLETVDDKKLQKRIFDASGIDLSVITMKMAKERLERDEQRAAGKPGRGEKPTEVLSPTEEVTEESTGMPQEPTAEVPTRPADWPTEDTTQPTTEEDDDDGIVYKAAEEDFEYEEDEDGGIIITKYIGEQKRISIPDKIDGKPVVEIDELDDRLKEIVFPESLKVIGGYAFGGCNDLTELILPKGITTIGEGAFSYCETLSRVSLPDSVTELGKSAFYYSPNVNVEYRGMSYDSDHIDELYQAIRDAKEPVLLSAEDYEYEDDGNGGIILTKYIGEEYAFIIPDEIDGKPVTAIGMSAFSYNTKIDRVYLPDSITSIGDYAFAGSGIKEIKLGSGIVSIGKFAFGNCKKLTEIVLPDGLTDIGDFALSNCDGLTEIVIPDGMTILAEYVFSNCTALENVILPESLTMLDDGVFNGCTSLETIVLPHSLTVIEDNVFTDCVNLKEITIPDSVTQMEECFSGCESLASIVIPDSVTGYVGGFDGCISLTDVTVGNGVVDLGSFRGCVNLKNIKIGNSVRTIRSYAFRDCVSLEKITLPASLVDIWGDTFMGCDMLSEITFDGPCKQMEIVDGVLLKYDRSLLIYCPANREGSYTMPSEVQSLSNAAFYGCKLSEIILSENLTSISQSAFEGCKNLKEIIIPDITSGISHYAFADCTSLERVVLSDGVLGIGEKAFRDCTSLTEVVFGDSLMELGYMAFMNCESLKELALPDSLKGIKAEVFEGCNDIKLTYKGEVYDLDDIDELNAVMEAGRTE